MNGPQNLRVYGLLLQNSKLILSAEQVAGRHILKITAGGVEPNETPEQALVREFEEECQLPVQPVKLLNSPGTLFSQWTFTYYKPLYYLVISDGNP